MLAIYGMSIIFNLFNFLEFVATVPDPQGNGHEIVVDQTSKCCKKTHQKCEIAHLENCVHSSRSQGSLKDTKSGSDQEEHKTVPHITKHDTEQEGEGDDCEN